MYAFQFSVVVVYLFFKKKKKKKKKKQWLGSTRPGVLNWYFQIVRDCDMITAYMKRKEKKKERHTTYMDISIPIHIISPE